jgi:Asp-tRNA(Asn)/Glu-tRNA(Gln) amidotransferase A subunit family amidase
MDRTDIPYISVIELAELIRKREVSPIEAVEAYLERIESLNGKLNAFLTVCRDEALEAAQEVEQALSRGNYLGPMHGIPVALKGQVYTIGHDNRISYLVGSILPAQAYYKAQRLRALLRQQVLEALERVDVLALPTAGIAAPKVKPDPIVDSKEKANRNSAVLTPMFSLASVPALSICCGFTSENLPIGLQIGGKPFDEETVLEVAYAYEQNTPWRDRKPPI